MCKLSLGKPTMLFIGLGQSYTVEVAFYCIVLTGKDRDRHATHLQIMFSRVCEKFGIIRHFFHAIIRGYTDVFLYVLATSEPCR